MVAMHVSIGMPSAAFMVYLSVNVWVCVCMVVVHVNRSWKKKKPQPNLVIKKKKMLRSVGKQILVSAAPQQSTQNLHELAFQASFVA